MDACAAGFDLWHSWRVVVGFEEGTQANTPRYRGPDRRGSMLGVPRPSQLRSILAVVVASAAAVLGARWAPSVVGRDGIYAVLGVVSAVLLAVAGAAAIIRWRLDGLARSYWFGLAALALALPALFSRAPADVATAVTAGSYLAIIVLTVIALRAPQVDNRISVLRSAGVTTAAIIGGFVIGAYFSAAHTRTLAALAVAGILGAITVWTAVVYARSEFTNGAWFLPVLAASACAPVANVATGTGGIAGRTGAPALLAAAGIAVAGAVTELHFAAARHRAIALAATIARDDAVQRRLASQDEIAAQMHEVRSRVAAIEGGVSVITPSQDASLAAAIQAEIERLRKLVTPSAPTERGPFPLLEALRPTLVVAASSWPVNFDVPEDLVAIGSPDDLAQVVHGLIHNAVRYASGSPIDISAGRDGDHIVVMVDDRGPGVPRGQREAIFERGFRAGGGSDGFGLGLAIAREVLAAQDGEIWVAPRPGGGARFVVSLPAWNGLSAVDAGATRAEGPEIPASGVTLSDDDRAIALRRLGGTS